ncbi:hypothetical protein JST97_14315 [bacterium]|nr:hypothetical protein [bacterium]
MRIELTLNHQARVYEVEPGTLLSELLQTEQGVWLEGRLVDASRMLAAQAHGRNVEFKAVEVSLPLQELLLAPEPTRC